MHSSIVRSEQEIRNHLQKLAALADNKNEEIARINLIIYEALMGIFIQGTNPEGILNKIPSYKDLAKSTKLIVDLCLWLTGKFNTPPTYNPLDEEQFSVEQTLEDFGNTQYTEFKIG